MNCRVILLISQNTIGFPNQNGRNPQLVLASGGIPATKDDSFRRQFKQWQQVLQSGITRIDICPRLGSRLTIMIANANMAVKATVRELVIIEGLSASISIVLNHDTRHPRKEPFTIPHSLRRCLLGPIGERGLGVNEHHFYRLFLPLHKSLFIDICGITF